MNRPERRCEVLIVGGGPTGLFLAVLLAARGVDVRVLERRREVSAHSRAIGLHPPALAALAAVGLHEAAVRQGTQIYCGRARAREGDLGQVRFGRAWPERPYVLSMPQSRTELLLEERLAALAPAALYRGWEVTALRTHHGGVEVTAREDGASVPGMRIRASVVVGADGARSRVRELLAIGTTGTEHPDTYLMGDLADPADGSGNTASAREAFIHLEPDGVVESFPLPDGRRRWVVHTGVNPPAHPAPETAPETLTELVRSRTRIRLDPGSTTMLSAFTVRRRSAWPLLRGRAVLLGDAAHEISPIGGQGITLGLLDALDVAPLLKRSVTRRRRGPLRADPPWRRAARRVRRRALVAGMLAHANTAAGRPLPSSLSWLRQRSVRLALSTPLRHVLGWVYSMGWTSASAAGGGTSTRTESSRAAGRLHDGR
ncbi:MAG: FAD-dependent monooxygenase [Brachybacterium sp.]